MNWKYLVGKAWSVVDKKLQRSNSTIIRKSYPYDRNWMLDVKRILNKDAQLIVDAGANIGSFSKELNFWFPNAEIYAFEPVKSTFNTLKQNTADQPQIQPFQHALGETAEKITISLNSENTINSLKVELADNPIGTEEISVIRLDNFLEQRHKNHIDILKIDVEGFEFEVLKGCGNLTIDCVFLEVGYVREPTKVHFSDVERYMEDLGYQLCGIYEIMRNFYDKKSLAYSNNLYIKKSLL